MKNLQMLEIKYLGATNTKGARIKIIDTRFKASITLSRDYEGDMEDQALKYLISRGFNIVAKCHNEITGALYLLSDTFKPINKAVNND